MGKFDALCSKTLLNTPVNLASDNKFLDNRQDCANLLQFLTNTGSPINDFSDLVKSKGGNLGDHIFIRRGRWYNQLNQNELVEQIQTLIKSKENHTCQDLCKWSANLKFCSELISQHQIEMRK